MSTLAGFLAIGTLNGGSFSELTGASGYSRQPVTMETDETGRMFNVNAADFAGSLGATWPGSDAMALYDAASGGNVLYSWGAPDGAFPGATRVKSKRVEIGEIEFQFPAPTSRMGSPVIPGPALRKPVLPSGVPTFALLGDSITDQNSRYILPPASTPSSAWFADGYATWFRILSRQRVNIPLANDFGVSGDTLQQMLARVGSVLAVRPDYCIVLGGSNNFGSDNFASMRTAWLAIIQALLDAGIQPVILPAPPRGGGALNAAQLQLQMRFTEFQRNYCARFGIIFVDYLPYMVNQANTASEPISGMLKADNLHPASLGAYWMGKALADTMERYLPPDLRGFLSPADIFSADNPTGNLLYSGTTNRGLLAGTGGTQTASTNLTYSGALAAGATFIRSGSSTSTVTLSKENPRTDRTSGERQVVQIAQASGGTTDEVYNLRFAPAIADVSAGDWYFAEASIEMSVAPVNMHTLEMYLIETRPSNSQTSIDLGLRDFSHGQLPGVTWKGVLRTPPIQRQADATSLQVNIRARFGAGAASATFKVGDFAVRKFETL